MDEFIIWARAVLTLVDLSGFTLAGRTIAGPGWAMALLAVHTPYNPYCPWCPCARVPTAKEKKGAPPRQWAFYIALKSFISFIGDMTLLLMGNEIDKCSQRDPSKVYFQFHHLLTSIYLLWQFVHLVDGKWNRKKLERKFTDTYAKSLLQCTTV